MNKEEYLSVKQISQLTELSTRHIRRIIGHLKLNHNDFMINKDKKEAWRIHHLLLPNFKPQRKRKNKYYALTIDPVKKYSEHDLHLIMKFVFDQLSDDKLEINYTIETKKANGVNHLHCFVKSENRKKIIDVIRIAFSEVSYKEAVMYDLEGWKSYITKDNNNIIKLKKNNQNGPN